MVIAVIGCCAGCDRSKASVSTKNNQSQKAAQAAQSISFTENAEIDNIKSRLELTSDPGLTGFVLLMNEAGQPIMYTGVKGKITSGGKRLTAPFQCHRSKGRATPEDCASSPEFAQKTVAPSDEGTWGHSNPYVYFWTTTGQYVQWNGKYLYSDKPFRTKVDPLVIAVK